MTEIGVVTFWLIIVIAAAVFYLGAVVLDRVFIARIHPRDPREGERK